MKFVILSKDGPEGAQKRPLFRPAHLQRLEAWAQLGKVILAGPLTDTTGSLIVVEAASLEEVQAFANEDPYTIHGVLKKSPFIPFYRCFPKPMIRHDTGKRKVE
jgi:uncharacterized protein